MMVINSILEPAERAFTTNRVSQLLTGRAGRQRFTSLCIIKIGKRIVGGFDCLNYLF